MENDVLHILPTVDVQKLLRVLRDDLPYSVVAYSWINKQLQWALKIPEIKLEIMCPRGDWQTGTVVGVSHGLILGGLSEAIVYCLDGKDEELKEALSTTQRIPWHNLYFFSGVLDKHKSTLTSVMTEKNVKFLDDLDPAFLHFMTAEDASNYPVHQLEPGIRVGSLDLSHLDTVCNNWPHYTPSFRPVVAQMIQKNISTAVFVTQPDGREELASMVLETEYGGIGLLQTIPAFRRSGLGSVTLTHHTRKLGQAGVNPHLHVISQNQKAIEFFKKTKYKVISRSHWIVMVRENMDIAK